jgi:hypothetical protein
LYSIGSHHDSDNGELKDDNEEETPLGTNILSPAQSSNRPTSPKFDSQNPSYNKDIPPTSTASYARPTPLFGKKKKPQPETAASTLMKYILEKNEAAKNTPAVTLDNPIDCFLFGISSTLKSLPPYLQHLAKSEIFSTVQKFELQILRNKQIDCSLMGQADQNTPYRNSASFHPPDCTIENTSSSGSVE